MRFVRVGVWIESIYQMSVAQQFSVSNECEQNNKLIEVEHGSFPRNLLPSLSTTGRVSQAQSFQYIEILFYKYCDSFGASSCIICVVRFSLSLSRSLFKHNFERLHSYTYSTEFIVADRLLPQHPHIKNASVSLWHTHLCTQAIVHFAHDKTHTRLSVHLC